MYATGAALHISTSGCWPSKPAAQEVAPWAWRTFSYAKHHNYGHGSDFDRIQYRAICAQPLPRGSGEKGHGPFESDIDPPTIR